MILTSADMSTKAVRQVNEEHVPDAAWIIALWKAIHGGDPSPEDIAEKAIASLANYVSTEFAEELGMAQLQRALKPLGISVTLGGGEGTELVEAQTGKGGGSKKKTTALSANPGRPSQPYCFRWAGQTICIPRPSVDHSPWK
jgi:hypothetical protein